ncbi:MAG: hypothetical protein GSR84_04570 [Desulfurococcales archaeon]|nr:hypothetical protein [Desulfurococcales archaeon]
MDPATAWVLGLFSMLFLLVYAWHRTGDLRLAFMASLLWGKVLSGAYWLLGLDYKIWDVYYVSSQGWVRLGEVTAAGAMFIIFLVSNIVMYYWPTLSPQILSQRQELPGLPSRRRG